MRQKCTQKEIKELVAKGQAIDVTNARYRSDVAEPYEVIKYSMGKYGCNGLVMQGRSGRLYAVTARTTATQIFF